MSKQSPIQKLAEIAQEQWGLITRRQAYAAGVSPATIARLAADGSMLERHDHGVYRLVGAPLPDHVELRAAWLQLSPDLNKWERTAEHGVVSHRSAADLYGLGDLPADWLEFTFPTRRQSRRPDIRLHHRRISKGHQLMAYL
jgi:predicted transcriptional regulator of viral defense system